MGKHLGDALRTFQWDACSGHQAATIGQCQHIRGQQCHYRFLVATCGRGRERDQHFLQLFVAGIEAHSGPLHSLARSTNQLAAGLLGPLEGLGDISVGCIKHLAE